MDRPDATVQGRILNGARVLLVAGALSWQSAALAQEDFVVREGYLSTSVGELVDYWGWSLVWRSDEDRMIDHAFSISNDSLEGALEGLLAMYSGRFVADLFEDNRVVLVGLPPPQVDVLMPGEVVAPDDTEEAGETDTAASGGSTADEPTVALSETTDVSTDQSNENPSAEQAGA